MPPAYITAIYAFDREQTREGPMTRPNSQISQHALEAMAVVFVLGTLSMIWPGIIALAFGVLLLLQSFLGAEQEMAILSWAEISNLPMVFTSLRRFGSPTIPS
jgi:uncharacterized membrane protein